MIFSPIKQRGFVLGASLLLAGCSAGSGESQGADLPIGATSAAKAQIFDTVFKQCGDWWGGKVGNSADRDGREFQLRNVRLSVQQSILPLSENDKFNDIEWQGVVYLYADASRERETGSEDWTPWKSGLPHNMAGSVPIQKVRGAWRVVHPEKLGSTAACPD